MSIATAQARITAALGELSMESIDDASTVRAEGNLLVFEGCEVGNVETTYEFGLYIAKKVLNKKTSVIYADIDYVIETIARASKTVPLHNAMSVRSVSAVGFENGVLEYRCAISVTESKMIG